MDTLHILKPASYRGMFYHHRNSINIHLLKDCISKGDGTPVQLEDLKITDDMTRYKPVPAFTYNAAVFPPYGDTKHHWYITTYSGLFSRSVISLITNSKEEILGNLMGLMNSIFRLYLILHNNNI